MSGTPWSKFFWSDWLSEPALRNCSLAARGLWMDMLCIAAAHDPIGYVAVAGTALSDDDIARMSAASSDEVSTLISQLERNGVFSRTRTGMIYSRRMTKDAKKASTARKNGKKGGNPSLSKQTTIPPSDNPELIPPDKPHKPEAIIPERKRKEAQAPPGGSGQNSLFETLPDWIPRQAWNGWVEMRQQARKPLKTERMVTLAVNELKKLKDQGSDLVAVIEKATLKCWTSFYPVDGTPGKGAPRPATRSADDEMRRKIQLFRDRGIWLSVDGPPPGDPDCGVPKHILIEFGYHKAAA